MTQAPRIILLLLFLLLATLYNICVPLGEGPDEAGHMEYVLFLAREGRLPVQGTSAETSDVPGEGHQPPLAYLLALPAVRWLPPDVPPFEQTANPAFLWNGGDQHAAYMRASHEYWPWHGIVLGWHLARGISALLGACAVVCTWGAARAICTSANPQQREAIALLAAVLVAFNPQFLFTSALVTNDVLLIALSAALLWLCATFAHQQSCETHAVGRTPQPARHMVFAGLLLGLALLTKQNALLLAMLPLWASWCGAWSERGWSVQRFILLVACWSCAALIIAGWWYVRNWQIYGDPLGMQAFRALFLTQPFEWHSPVAWISALERLHASFWAYFGWISLPTPAPIIWFYSALEVAALVGLVRIAGRSRQGSGIVRRWVHSVWLPVVVLPLLACAWTISFALTAGLVAWQGRMLFVALPAIAILLARGLWAAGQEMWSTSQRISRYQAVVFCTSLLLLAAWLPVGFIAPAYTWHTLPQNIAHMQLGIPVYARYAKPWEQGAELRGWRLEREGSTIYPVSDGMSMNTVEAAAGETVTLTLTWHCLERIEHNWTVFIHLVDAEEQIVAEDNSIPQHGSFPMPLWTPGDWLQDTHLLVLPADLAPGDYVLRVGLYLPWQRDPQSGRRQDTWAEDGTDRGDFAEIGIVRIR